VLLESTRGEQLEHEAGSAACMSAVPDIPAARSIKPRVLYFLNVLFSLVQWFSSPRYVYDGIY
jgi:hypothetical protein